MQTFDEQRPRMGLARGLFGGLLAVGSARLITQLVSWLITVFVMRLLHPVDYGLMAMSVPLVTILMPFNDLGLGAAIIQKPSVAEDDFHTCFWFNLAISIGLFLAVCGLAPAVAWFFEEPRVRQVMPWLALSLLATSLRLVPYATLTRRLDFGRRAGAEIAAGMLSAAVAGTLAWAGADVWTLVAAHLAQAFGFAVCLTVVSPWRPRLRFSLARAKALLGFGAKFTGSSLLVNSVYSADNFIIGKLLGRQSLGYYSVGMQLAHVPTDKLSSIATQVAFPVLARFQDDRKAMARAFLALMDGLALVAFPLMVGLMLVAGDFVGVVLTEKWLPIVPILWIVPLYGMMRAIGALLAPVANAIGKVGKTLRYSTAFAVTLPVGLLLAARFGLTAVAWTWVVLYPLCAASLLRSVLDGLGIRLTDCLASLWPAAKGCLAMAVPMLICQALIEGRLSSMLAAALSGAFTYAAVTYLGMRRNGGDLVRLLAETVTGRRWLALLRIRMA